MPSHHVLGYIDMCEIQLQMQMSLEVVNLEMWQANVKVLLADFEEEKVTRPDEL